MTEATLMTETPAATTTEGQSAASETTASQSTEQQAQASGQEQQATEGKTTEAKTGDGEQGKGEQETAKTGAPEQYEFKAPDGTQLDDRVVAEFSEVARELDLPQDAAQKVIDKMAPLMAARQAEAVEAASVAWTEAAKTDKEFGGDKLDANMAIAKTALDKFGTPELRSLLNESRLGNHPEVIRFMVRAGKAISEDSVVSGKGPQAAQKGGTRTQQLATNLYPNQ